MNDFLLALKSLIEKMERVLIPVRQNPGPGGSSSPQCSTMDHDEYTEGDVADGTRNWILTTSSSVPSS